MLRLRAVTYIIIVASLLAGIAVYLATGPQAHVFAQIPTAFVPNLVGNWTGSNIGTCKFEDVGDPNGTPYCQSQSQGSLTITITVQQGRAFAGVMGWPGSKLTGVLAADGTVCMQGDAGNQRYFMRGTIQRVRNSWQINMLANGFEDWGATIPSMESDYFTLTKSQ